AVVALLAFVLDAVSAGDGRALSVDTERVTRLGDDFDEVVGACVPDLVNAMARAARATHTLGRNRNTLGGRVETNLGLAARNAADPFSRLASQDLTPGDLGTRDRSFFAFGLGFGCSALACRTFGFGAGSAARHRVGIGAACLLVRASARGAAVR